MTEHWWHNLDWEEVKRRTDAMDPYSWAGLSDAEMTELEIQGSNPADWHEVPVKFTKPASAVVSMRISYEDLRVLDNAARFHGERLSSYIRRAALIEARKPLLKFSVTVA